MEDQWLVEAKRKLDKMPEEAKLKISLAHKGRKRGPMSEERKLNLSNIKLMKRRY